MVDHTPHSLVLKPRLPSVLGPIAVSVVVTIKVDMTTGVDHGPRDRSPVHAMDGKPYGLLDCPSSRVQLAAGYEQDKFSRKIFNFKPRLSTDH